MSPVRDTNLNLSPQASDLPLIATNKLSANTIEINGTPLAGLAVRLNVAFTLGNTAVLTPSLNVIIRAASSTPVASSDDIAGELRAPITIADVTGSQTFERIIPFVTSKRYVRAEFAVVGVASDSPAWTVVDAYIVEPVGQDWTRQVEFT